MIMSFNSISQDSIAFNFWHYFPLVIEVVDVGSLKDDGKENDDNESEGGGSRPELCKGLPNRGKGEGGICGPSPRLCRPRVMAAWK